MHEGPPKNEEMAGKKTETTQRAESLPLERCLEEQEKDKIFEDAKKAGAWFPIQEGLRVGISKNRLVLYAQGILAEKAQAGDAEGIVNFRGALERHGFEVFEHDWGLRVGILNETEKIPDPAEENAPKKEIQWASGLIEHLTEKEIKKRFEQSIPEGPFTVIRVGTQLGISPEILTAYAKDVVAKKAESGNFAGAVNLLAFADGHNVFVGTKEDLDRIVREFYAESMRQENYDGAMECARLKGEWGLGSPEYAAALYGFKKKTRGENWEEEEEKREKELEKWSAKISKETTIKDLFDAIDEGDEDLQQSDIFWGEIHDNFNPEVADELLDIQGDPIKMANTKVIDFFKKHDVSRKDIEIFLPNKLPRCKHRGIPRKNLY